MKLYRPPLPCLETVGICLSANLLFMFWATLLPAEEPTVQFDVPALTCARTIASLPASEPDAAAETYSASLRQTGDKLIEVVVPVTTEVVGNRRDSVSSFRFDVFWNRNAYPLVDYAPKTQTVADVAGVINVEDSDETNRGMGLSLNGKYDSMLSGNATAEIGSRHARKTRFEEVPQHEILVAAGTSHRGTGAFFRFHPSRRETLEGGRELVLIFRVPQQWRGGLLKVECRAIGQQTILGSWKEEFEFSRAFVLPIYLDGDQEARDAAVSYVRSEHGLRQQWQQRNESTETDLGDRLLNLVSIHRSPPAPNSNVPDQWVHYLIQSGSDDYLEKFRPRLSEDLTTAADQFVAARQTLLQLSR